MSRVLLGQSYYLRFDPKLWRARQPYAPLGALYAAALVRGEGHDVTFFDAMLARSEHEWDEALERSRPDVAVLFEDNFNYLSKMCLLRMRRAALTMVGMARARGVDVFVAGADVTDNPDVYLDAGAAAAILGEGERTLVELLRARAERRALTAIAGVALRTADGPTVRTGVRPDIADLDRLPRPAWDLVDVDAYRRTWRAHHGRFSMNVATTRGCPYSCNWCAKPIWGQRHAVRSPEDVCAEVVWLVRTYAPDHLWFVDDIFGLRPGWLARFAELLAQHGVRVPFKSLTRADLVLRPGEVEALARAGCESVWLGAESGSQYILDAMEKGIDVAQIDQATRALRASGIRVGFFLQFGYPGETRDDVERTLELVRRCAPDDIGMSVAYPLPGTRFHERVQASLGLRRNWVDSSDLAMLYQGPYGTAFYRQLHRVLHKEFRLQHARERGGRADPSGRNAARVRAARLYDALTLPLARWRLDRLARA